jgi:hypothetical protein
MFTKVEQTPETNTTGPMSEWILTGTGLEKMIIEIEKAERYRGLFDDND